MKKLLGTLMLLVSFNVLAADPQLGKDFDKTLQAIPKYLSHFNFVGIISWNNL